MYGRSGVDFPHCCGGGLDIYRLAQAPTGGPCVILLDIAVFGFVSDEALNITHETIR